MKRKRLIALGAFACLLVIATIIGCTSVGEGFLFPGARAGHFAFVVNGNADGSGAPVTIGVYRINSSTGALTAVTGSPFNVFSSSCCDGEGSSFIDVDTNAQFVFVPRTTEGSISVFSVNQDTGALTEISGSPFDAGTTNPYAVKLNPAGTFLYVVNYSENSITQFSVASSGALAPVGSALPLECDPHQIAMDPQGRFLYVGNECADVEGFTINSSTGALTAMAGNPFPADGDVYGGLVDAGGRFYLSANKWSCDPGTISVFNIDQSTGELSEVANSPFISSPDNTGNSECGPLQVVEAIVQGQAYMAANNYCCAPASSGSENIAVFTFDTSTGDLAMIADSPFNFHDYQWPHYLAVDPVGGFGYILDYGVNCCDTGPSTITAISFGSGGEPTEVTGSPFSNGTNSPNQIIIR